MAECDQHTFAQVKAMVAAGYWSPVERGVAETWLKIKEAAREEEQERLENRSVAAAERAATASETAATLSAKAVTAARDSARWTMWAALLSLFATLVTVLPSIFERLFP